MGYRGKVEEQQRARELRAQAWTLREIADALGVAKSSVSRWTRDIEFDPASRRSRATGRVPRTSDHPLRRRKLAEIERVREEARRRIGHLTDRELLMLGLGLYAGDGAKTGHEVRFANSDPRLVAVFCAWLRGFFDVDEARLRLTLYLHEELDLEAAQRHWAEVCAIPPSQFYAPYRAKADGTIRRAKHVHGCAHVRYGSVHVLREILGLMGAVVEREEWLRGPGSNRRHSH